MTAEVSVSSPKIPTRKTREEANDVRNMNFPVPISIFDHRVVRPNYAQRRRRFSLLELFGPAMIFCSTAA